MSDMTHKGIECLNCGIVWWDKTPKCYECRIRFESLKKHLGIDRLLDRL